MYLQSAFYSILRAIFWIPLRMFRVEVCGQPRWPLAPELLKFKTRLLIRIVGTRMLGGGLLGMPIMIAVTAAIRLFKHRKYIAKGTITTIYIGREKEGRRIRQKLLQHLKNHGLEDLETALKLNKERIFTCGQVLRFTTRALQILYRDSFFSHFICAPYIAVIFILFLVVSSVPGIPNLGASTGSQLASIPLSSLDSFCGELQYNWEKREKVLMVGTIIQAMNNLPIGNLVLTRSTLCPEQVRESARWVCFKLGEEWGKTVGEIMARNDMRDMLLRYNVKIVSERGGRLASEVVVDHLVTEIQHL